MYQYNILYLDIHMHIFTGICTHTHGERETESDKQLCRQEERWVDRLKDHGKPETTQGPFFMGALSPGKQRPQASCETLCPT